MSVFALAVLLAQPAITQPKSDPFPDGTAQYHLAFDRIFPPEKTQREAFETALRRLEAMRGHVTVSPKRAIALYEEVLKTFERYDAYLYLRYVTDTTNTAAQSEESNLSADFEKRTAFLDSELSQLTRNVVPYSFFTATARSRRIHHLPLEKEETLRAVEPLTVEWTDEMYDVLTSQLPHSTSDSRAQAFHARWDALAARRDLYAFTLIHLANARNTIAQMHHFDDAASQIYARSFWTKAQVTRLLDEIAATAAVYTRYQLLRAEHAGGNLWDLNAPVPDRPRFTIDDARTVLQAAFEPIGPRYSSALNNLLDPSEGRLDITPGPHRRRGGFSKGFPGFRSVFYMSGFTGEYNDVRIIAHESTHAVQRQLESEHGVRPVYANGPGFLFEAYAIFNELLLPDFLYRQEANERRKQFYLEQFLESKGIAVIFTTASEAAIEQAIYAGVARGTIRNADDLDALTRTIGSKYSIWPEKQDELRMQWMQIPLMYDDPFYDVNYTWAGILALKFFAMYQRDPSHFMDRYAALIANGFDARPADLLRRFLGIDLYDPELVRDAIAYVGPKIDELAAAYHQPQ